MTCFVDGDILHCVRMIHVTVLTMTCSTDMLHHGVVVVVDVSCCVTMSSDMSCYVIWMG